MNCKTFKLKYQISLSNPILNVWNENSDSEYIHPPSLWAFIEISLMMQQQDSAVKLVTYKYGNIVPSRVLTTHSKLIIEINLNYSVKQFQQKKDSSLEDVWNYRDCTERLKNYFLSS